MKLPIVPLKPRAPHKPSPPPKIIKGSRNFIVDFDLIEEYDYPVAEIMKKIKLDNIDLEKCIFRFSSKKDYSGCYYDHDEPSITASISIFSVEDIDNPNYEKQYKQYLKYLNQYKEKYKKYKEKLKQYKEKEVQYQIEMDKYRIWNAERMIEISKKNLEIQKIKLEKREAK